MLLATLAEPKLPGLQLVVIRIQMGGRGYPHTRYRSSISINALLHLSTLAMILVLLFHLGIQMKERNGAEHFGKGWVEY